MVYKNWDFKNVYLKIFMNVNILTMCLPAEKGEFKYHRNKLGKCSSGRTNLCQKRIRVRVNKES